MHEDCLFEIQIISKKHREKLGTIIGIEAEVSEVRYRPKLSLDELERMAASGPNLPLAVISNAAVQSVIADFDALPQHY